MRSNCPTRRKSGYWLVWGATFPLYSRWHSVHQRSEHSFGDDTFPNARIESTLASGGVVRHCVGLRRGTMAAEPPLLAYVNTHICPKQRSKSPHPIQSVGSKPDACHESPFLDNLHFEPFVESAQRMVRNQECATRPRLLDRLHFEHFDKSVHINAG